MDCRRRDRAGGRIRVCGAWRRVPARRRPVRVPARRLASARRVPLWLGAARAHRKRRDRRRRDHVRHLRAQAGRTARHRARAAGRWGRRPAVGRQLSGRQTRQPRAERLRRAEGRRAGGADRGRVLRAGARRLVDGRARDGYWKQYRARWLPSARRSSRSCSRTAGGRMRTTSRKRSRIRAATCRSASSPARSRSWSSTSR